MVLDIALRFFPYDYAVHIIAAIITLAVLRAFSQGRTTTRERDLHGRTFLVTGGFTPLGLTLLQSLAERGAKLIALSPYPIDSPAITILVNLLRTTHNNDHIYAEQCDLHNPEAVRKFCMRFLTEGESERKGKDKYSVKVDTDTRLDGIIFAHEYQHLGIPNLLRRKHRQFIEGDDYLRDSNALATFLIVTLLLPVLLVAPVERDIRIVSVINPFYAAAATTTFDPAFRLGSPSSDPSKPSIFLSEGRRSLRTVVFMRHLQRIFDALPKPQVPKTEDGSSTVPIISARLQRSNIVAVSVSPGISRVDTVSRLLNADWNSIEYSQALTKRHSWSGIILYLLALPFLHIFTKSPKSAIQSVLHALFLPTPFKILSQSTDATDLQGQNQHSANSANAKQALTREEVLKPGVLYSECAIVRLDVAVPTIPDSPKQEATEEKEGLRQEVLQIEPDGEYGGEVTGRMVWEAYEEALKIWEKATSAKQFP